MPSITRRELDLDLWQRRIGAAIVAWIAIGAVALGVWASQWGM